MPFDPYNTPPYEGATPEERRALGIDFPDIQQELQQQLPLAERFYEIFDSLRITTEQIAKNLQVGAASMQNQVGTLRTLTREASRLEGQTAGASQGGILNQPTQGVFSRISSGVGLQQLRTMMRTGGGLSLQELLNFEVGPVLGAALAIPAGLRQIDRRVLGPQFRDPTALGQITGEGWQAGMAARWQGRIMALNPFDMMTRQVAEAIIQGTRQAGFSGELAQNFQESVAGLYNDLGIQVDQLIQMQASALRDGQATLESFNAEMKNLDDVAKTTGSNVANLARDLNEFAVGMARTGGPGTFPIAQEQITAQLLAYGFGEGSRQRVLQWRTGVQTRFAALAGYPAWEATSPDAIRAVTQLLDQRIRELLAQKPQNISRQAWARWLIYVFGTQGQILEGLQVQDLLRIWGSDPDALRARQSEQAAMGIYETAIEAMDQADRPIGGTATGKSGPGAGGGAEMRYQMARRQAFVNELARISRLRGITGGALAGIIEPLQGSIGNARTFAAAQEAARQQLIKIQLDLTPQAKQVIRNPQGLITYNWWTQGQGRPYGAIPPPGG